MSEPALAPRASRLAPRASRLAPRASRRSVGDAGERQLRAWLEYVAETAIDWLDALDRAGGDREPEDDGPEGFE